jgi:hypothetical protein
MPFGLCKAPALFSVMMVDLLRDLVVVLVFMDDILIFSRDIDEHHKHVAEPFWSTLWGSRTGRGHIHASVAGCTAPHFPSQYAHCSGCHLELKQVGFTDAYRTRQ